ncbi:elongation factor P [Cyclobacterium marinum]|uniref:Elongation factor P n=1 Tax=Cyclobacterium marinum (strain ATCC 25205 / DSM 745 / LMG 13164 / NCIMB 1802) TaxID=880070 RepID=G0IUJ9_CYCMS|nr:elongation factor P [Cyclobacterium marinum]AEL24762.1 Elongation factor P [Cyclobacterium marinum DSM 745]MBI0401763.1 elongation factor P [Cyclobacterium marinum]MBR9776351.1 elongation factor P [Cytophagales bacterium]|tara:strand:+ start:118901 stop:119464 length:564 start_codon:yes stop_codon:yes gene_type:complete
MASTADFKNGLCLEFNHDIVTIVEFQHVKPGKGPAFVRTKLKSLTNGKVVDKTFNSGEKITTARVEKRPHQYIYNDDMGYHFMDTSTFEQIPIEEKLIERPELLKEGQMVDILIHDETETPLGVELPPFVELMVTYTEPGIKGDTATNTLKPATLETGAVVMVPLFVDQDIMIKVDTRDGSYSERVK